MLFYQFLNDAIIPGANKLFFFELIVNTTNIIFMQFRNKYGMPCPSRTFDIVISLYLQNGMYAAFDKRLCGPLAAADMVGTNRGNRIAEKHVHADDGQGELFVIRNLEHMGTDDGSVHFVLPEHV